MDLSKIKLIKENLTNNKKSNIQKKIRPIGLNRLNLQSNQNKVSNVIRMLTETNDDEYNRSVKLFREVLEKNFDPSLLHNFYYNSEWVKISRYKSFFTKIYTGTYDYNKNNLKFSEDSLFHELFHLASTNYDSKYMSTGFSLVLNKRSIGTGINEGYTDLLAHRYFGVDYSDAYLLEVKLAYNLELIIGKEILEKLYLQGDFFGFIRELNKYYNINDIEKFLIELDAVSSYCVNYSNINEAREINLLIENCVCFLMEGFCKVLKTKDYDIDVKKGFVEDCLKSMNTEYIEKYEEFEFNYDRINKVIEENLSKEIKINKNIKYKK